MSAPLATVRVVIRNLFIGFLLLGILSANLTGGAVDAALSPWTGRWLERIGLRQNWVMFAPNPTHHGSFAQAWAIERGKRRELPISLEPPPDGFFFRIGYDRLLKYQKKVTVEKGRFAKEYALALCRIHEVDGSVALAKVLYYTPSPSRRLKGWGRMRRVETLGTWPCR